MDTAPNLVGFAVQISTTQRQPVWPDAPQFLYQGRRSAISWQGKHLTVSGWAVQGSEQPVQLAEDGDCCVVLSGELYHSERLAEFCATDELDSDAAVLLSLWQRYGPGAARLLNGRFAAVVVHGQQASVLSDHAGGVPVFLASTEDGLAVSTEAKVLAGRTKVLPPPSVAGLTRPIAGLPSVCQARGASVLRIDLASGQPAGSRQLTGLRTWIAPEHRDILDPALAPGLLRRVLGDAVSARTAGHNTMVLSGGIDSSAVVALASQAGAGLETISLGTDAGNEFGAARLVAEHLGTEHHEVFESSETVVDRLPWAVAAAEITDPDVIEYLLPLVALYQRLDGAPRRILTGYGADIPLGGMYRTVQDWSELDQLIVADVAGVDGLNEMTPLLSGLAGHWSTHPYWDREVLDVLLRTEPGLKRRGRMDKWVLREAVRDLLPAETVNRPKLGVHEGSGTTSTWTLLLEQMGAAPDQIAELKHQICQQIYQQVVVRALPPEQVSSNEIMQNCVRSARTDRAGTEVRI
jgi:(carboxyethyl)arginine beta-lactam-synthase